MYVYVCMHVCVCILHSCVCVCKYAYIHTYIHTYSHLLSMSKCVSLSYVLEYMYAYMWCIVYFSHRKALKCWISLLLPNRARLAWTYSDSDNNILYIIANDLQACSSCKHTFRFRQVPSLYNCYERLIGLASCVYTQIPNVRKALTKNSYSDPSM
jgi:hypothetical protein